MGQPEFSQIVASAARESLVYSNLDQSASIPLNTSETIDLYAPAGTICTIKSVYIQAPAPVGATGGVHNVTLQSTQPNMDYLYGASVFGSIVLFDYGEWKTADSAKFPLSNSAVVISNITFDSVIGIRFLYWNQAGVAQNGTRNYRLCYVKRVIG